VRKNRVQPLQDHDTAVEVADKQETRKQERKKSKAKNRTHDDEKGTVTENTVSSKEQVTPRESIHKRKSLKRLLK
jgi:hypothetical protein